MSQLEHLVADLLEQQKQTARLLGEAIRRIDGGREKDRSAA